MKNFTPHQIDENLTPHHINENESDNRGAKEGWYAVGRNGTLKFGPFSSRTECLNEIAQSASESGRAPAPT